MIFRKVLIRIKIYKWKKEGAKIGENFQLERNSYLDSSFPWLIEIGNNVTVAPDVLILTHDGGTQKFINYSKIGKVKIGNNVFIGAKSIIMPNTVIGSNCVIGAGSVVSGTIPSGSVVAGAPGRVVQTIVEYTSKNQERLDTGIVFDKSYTRAGKITAKKKTEMIEALSENNGFIV